MIKVNLADRIALVNGASRGIGEAIARGLAASGATVVVSSRRLDSVEAVAESIRQAGGKAHAMACHAGHLDQIRSLVGAIDDQFGQLDILINCAATNPYYGAAEALPAEAFDKTVDVNLKGPYFMMSEAVTLMKAGGGGRIVNISSIAALNPMRGQAVYSMTKAGLVSLTKAFAKEYGAAGIRVNAILPGVVETKLASALVEDEEVQAWLATTPVGRAAQPGEMVDGVLFLVSDEASYTTGTTLIMDGGSSLGPG